MSHVLRSYAKVVENTSLLEFGPGTRWFNGTRGGEVRRAELRRQLTDSVEIELEYEEKPPDVFKLTNQSLLTWDDYWVDARTNLITDPKITELNLQRNKLVYVNINTPRLGLKTLNVEGNRDLQHLYVHEAPGLEELNITGCESLEYVSLGVNRRLRNLIANNCNMSEGTMEQLLRDFTPTLTANANLKGVGMFRKQHTTLLDLRGNEVVWSNRRIASKIRLLLCNNWVVKWDNNPPVDIVPPQLYAFYVESVVGR